ncbi:hypothetical protein GUJ93_ZPchr0458g22706 [Zizania palustris]|uniref:Epidermal patterning factor-like protein n=2 Tax=BOP clade TaxID=359160 RepID=A0A8J5RE00_ZIZPA|nr:hypothetical protein GUJ93_ZPchr0458g22706 [Zizania palustris]
MNDRPRSPASFMATAGSPPPGHGCVCSTVQFISSALPICPLARSPFTNLSSLSQSYSARARLDCSLCSFDLELMRMHALADARCHYHIPLLFLAFVLLLAATTDGIRPAPSDVKQVHEQDKSRTAATTTSLLISPQRGAGAITAGNGARVGFLQEEVYATGSSLPDCSHACGPCSPCIRVMVSFKCSIAEPCPMVYRCMCKGKCYPVPSS